MNIIIVGDGKVGAALATQLSSEGHDVTIIDSNPQALMDSSEKLDIMTVIGNGAAMSTLRDAGAERADILIAATSRDELNLLTCLTAKKLGVRHTIARVRNPEYSDQLASMREELGLSMTVNPELAAAQEAYQLLRFPSFLKRDSFAKGRVEIVAVPVDKDSKLVGIPLYKLYEIAGVNVLVCAVEREDGVHIPSGSFTLQEGDTIYVTAALLDLAELVKNMGLVEKRIRSLLIIGGSRIAFYLAKRCLDSGMSVKIIERDHDRCVKLVESLPRATVIEGDGSRQDLLDAEGLRSFDAVITLTGMDEENLVLSMLASHLGVGKVITKINRTNYKGVLSGLNMDSVIYPRYIASEAIIAYVRAKKASMNSNNIETLYHMFDFRVEAIEFRVKSESTVTGVPLAQLSLKKGLLISFINRKGTIIIPSGQDSIQVGDTVMVVTTHTGFKVLQDILN